MYPTSFNAPKQSMHTLINQLTLDIQVKWSPTIEDNRK